ncbi:hypothetical protein TNIN_347951 [Trichonephila inaurata madagascariensis]|uniref:Uncharacterized protein n=1 Tax=Trichonephila inaurata madagascariensis TaxID=2747483 RepID=A0A8X6YRM3_9ARAC|nr:hypothetical protein TNIN_347951 [Trichonephila inaurata madagascariensis]
MRKIDKNRRRTPQSPPPRTTPLVPKFRSPFSSGSTVLEPGRRQRKTKLNTLLMHFLGSREQKSISLFSIIKSRLPAYRISGTAFQNIGIPTGVGGDTSAFNQSASATCLEASLQANPTVRRIREEKRKGYPHQTKHWQFSSTQRDIGHSVTSTPDPFLSCKLVLNTPPLGSVPRQGMLFF